MITADTFNFQDIVHNLPDIVYRIDTEGNFVYINESVKRLGLHPNDLIGKHFSLLLGKEEAERVARDTVLTEFLSSNDGIDGREQPKMFDERRTGHRITKNLRISIPINGEGERIYTAGEVIATGFYRVEEDSSRHYIGTVGIIRDISELEKTELTLVQMRNYYENLLDKLIEIIFIIATDGTVLYNTRSIHTILGYDDIELVGENIYTLINQEDAGSLSDRIWLMKTQNVPFSSMTIRLINAHKNWRLIRFVVSPIHGLSDETMCFVIHAIDVTEQKLMMNELREEINLRKLLEREKDMALKKAEEANRAKSVFLSHMSHEVRNPLNAILGFTEIIESRAGDDEIKQLVGYVKNAGKNLLSVINQILTYSKLESGFSESEIIEFPITKLINDIHSMYIGLALQKGINFTARVSDSVTPTILTDENKLNQIVVNLLGNAFKFTDSGSIALEVENADEFLLIRCRDTGIGIPAEKRHEIFHPFTQGDMSTTRKYGGTGLGLSIVKNYAESLGGFVEVEENPGGGSVFTVAIRFRPGTGGVSSDDATAAVKKNVLGISSDLLDDFTMKFNTPHLRVLVAEDDELNQRLMERYFNHSHIDATIAGNGQIAIDLAQKSDFHLIFVDIQMPVIDGFELIKMIRAIERYRAVPVYIMTGNVVEESWQRAREIGVDGFLPKPVHFEEMALIVNKTLATSLMQ